jgi:hypothetical protein
MSQTTSSRHHYVPKCILKHFSNQNEELFIFNKKDGSIYKSHRSHAFVEKKFNTIEGHNKLEEIYTEIESKTAPIIDAIARKFSIDNISGDELDTLLSFCIVQKTRTHQSRENTERLYAGIIERTLPIIERSADCPKRPKILEGIELKAKINPNWVKAITATHLENINLYLNALKFNKNIYLLYARNKVFYIGDNPISMHNIKFHPIYQGYGFAVPNIEIYMPLTSKLTLAILDKHLPVTSIYRDRTLIMLNNEKVDYLNRLQVGWAKKLIVSKYEDFSTASIFLANNPDFKISQEGNMGVN